MVVVFKPHWSMLIPKLDLFACILGLKADRFGTITSPNLAAPQNAVVKQARTATLRLLVFQRCWMIFLMYSMVTGSCFCLPDSFGAIFCVPLTIVFSSGLSTSQMMPWMTCQAHIAATYPKIVDVL